MTHFQHFLMLRPRYGKLETRVYQTQVT
ncbi:hypothetical protein AX774_g6658, partial [Zancudomyces culisetae]